MNKLQFLANSVEPDFGDDDVLVVGFYAEEHYLMIQIASEFDEQDNKMGMNTYHIERDDQSYGNYGGVKKIMLFRNKVWVEMDEQGIKNLQCEEIEADFEADDETFAMLEKNLSKIFGDLLVVTPV
jgi:hypothetical protein